MSSGSLGRHALNGASVTLLWQAIRVIILFGSITILSRLLLPSDFGLFAMVLAVVGVAELVRDFGLSMAAVQARHLSAGQKSNLFWINAGIGLVLACVVALASGGVAAIYGEPVLSQVTFALSSTFLMNALSTQFKAQINRDLRFGALGVVETIPQLIGLAVAVGLAVTGSGVGALVGQSLAISASGLLFAVAFARWWPGLYDRSAPMRGLLRFGGGLLGAQSLAYAAKNVDTVGLGAAVGASALGYYSRAYQIVALPLQQVTAPLSRVAVPVLSRIRDDRPRYLNYVASGQFFTVVFASGLYGVVIGYAPQVVEVVLGPGWGETVILLQLLAVSGIFRALGQVPYWVFLSLGLTGAQFRLYLFGQPIIVALTLGGLPWGPVGVATGVAIGYAIFWILQVWWCARLSFLPGRHLLASALTPTLVLLVPTVSGGFVLNAFVSGTPLILTIGAAATIGYFIVCLMLIPPYRGRVSLILKLARRGRKP